MTDAEYIRQEPAYTETNPQGYLHIPIAHLEESLDYLRWGSQNYRFELLKDNEGGQCVAASIELVIQYTTPEGQVIQRTFVGATNFSLADIYPNKEWNATAKSMCIKNAASDIGKFFGRGLNAEVMPALPMEDNRLEPDDSIRAQLIDAQFSGNEEMVMELHLKYKF